MSEKHSLCLMNLKQLTIAILCVPCFSFAIQANGEIQTWSRIGPEGADINQILISPSHPNTLYAATSPSSYYSSSNESILKSLNGGESWVTLPWQGKGLDTDLIVANREHQRYSSFFYKPSWQGRSLIIHSSDPDTVFTSLSGFLLKTNDSGMSWRSVGRGINLDSRSFFSANTFINASLSALVSPDNTIASSDDGGEQWVLSKKTIKTDIQQVIESSPRYPEGESNIVLLNLTPENSTVLYGYTTLRHRSALATAPVLLYKSINNGENWLNITPEGYRYLGSRLAFDSDNSDIMFSIFAKTEIDSFITIVDEGLAMRSDNGGKSWQALNVPTTDTTQYDVTRIYLDPKDKNTLYANIKPEDEESVGGVKTIAKSVNSGETWDIIDISPYFPGSIVIDPVNNKKLFMSSKQGVLRSENGGQNWTLSNQGIQHVGGNLSIATDNAQVMYLAGNDLGSIVDNRVATGFYYKTIDGGQHWSTITPSTVVTGYCHEFTINPVNNQDVFCITNENIYQSLDGGEQWTFLKKSASQQLVRAQDGLSIYLSDSTGTSLSKDNGKSWHVISTTNEGELSIHLKNQATLYYVFDNQLYSSADNGEHWFNVETPENITFNHLVIHPLNPDLMVLYGSYGYVLTEDGGNSWRIILETFNNGNTEINSFPADFNFISQLVFNPTDVKSVFIKTSTGIYESSDLGAHWEIRNSGIESYISNSFIGVNLVTSSNAVYVDTPSGIFKLTGKVNFTAVADCVFSWAEQDNSDLFTPAPVSSEQWNGYTFRYYSETNTYLGIFHEQEIHQLQPNVSGDIMIQDSIVSYQAQSGCMDANFRFTGN